MKNCVLITGATGGLGKAYVEDCAFRGYDIVITATKQDRLDELKREIRSKYNVNMWTKAANLTDPKSREELFNFIDKSKIQLNMIINNAGYLFEGSFMGCSNEELLTAINVNIIGTIDLTYKFLERMNKGIRNYVLFVSSMAGFTPMPQMATYSATKTYLTYFSIALREELKNKNVYVSAVCPGSMATTEAMKKSIESQGFSGKMSLQSVNKVAKNSINKLLKNISIYIPGFYNHFMRCASSIPSKNFVASFINKRWTKCEKKRGVYR